MSKAWPVHDLDPNAPVEVNARLILRVRMGEFYSYTPIVDDQWAVEQLHNLRISTKRLRYTLEIFANSFKDLGEINTERAKQLQAALGSLHDADVRIALVQDELIRTSTDQLKELGRTLAMAPPSAHQAIASSALRPPPDDPRRGLIALLGREYNERSCIYQQFIDLWRECQNDGMRTDLAELSSRPWEGES